MSAILRASSNPPHFWMSGMMMSAACFSSTSPESVPQEEIFPATDRRLRGLRGCPASRRYSPAARAPPATTAGRVPAPWPPACPSSRRSDRACQRRGRPLRDRLPARRRPPSPCGRSRHWTPSSSPCRTAMGSPASSMSILSAVNPIVSISRASWRLRDRRDGGLRIAVDPHPVPHLAAQQLIDRQAQRLPGKVPQRDLHSRQRRNVLPALRPGEDTGRADPLERASTFSGSWPTIKRRNSAPAARRRPPRRCLRRGRRYPDRCKCERAVDSPWPITCAVRTSVIFSLGLRVGDEFCWIAYARLGRANAEVLKRSRRDRGAFMAAYSILQPGQTRQRRWFPLDL